MDRFINVELLANPYNWIIVALMLAIFVFAMHYLTAPVAQLVAADPI